MLAAADLVRLGELVKLAAEMARLFSDTAQNGELSRVADIANRMQATSDELIEAGHEMGDGASMLG